MARTKTQTAQETPVSEERPTWGAVAVRARNAQMTGIDTLIPYAHNARTHSPEQLMRLRESLRAFGFVQPILIDEERNVLAGHGRLAAARAEGMRQVPCVVVTGLTEAERRAYILADNRLAELAGWDTEELALELGALEALDFPIEATGFDLSAGGEIDLTPLSPAGVHVQEHERGELGRVLGAGLRGNLIYQGRSLWSVESMGTESLPTVILSAICHRATEQDTESIIRIARSRKFRAASSAVKQATLERYFDVETLFGRFTPETLPSRYLRTYARVEKLWGKPFGQEVRG